MESSGASTTKVSIKGFSLTSKSSAKPITFAKNISKPSPSSTLGKRQRAALQDGSEDEDEDEDFVPHEAVTGFDIREGGALKTNEAVVDRPLVIPKLKNRDWREEIRRSKQKGKNLLPPEVQAQRKGKGPEEVEGEDMINNTEEVKWGLTVTKKPVISDQDHGDDPHNMKKDNETEIQTITEVLVERPREKTTEELAIAALMGAKTEKKGPDLVIPTAKNGEKELFVRPITEDDAYRRAIHSAPDVSTLEDYERVPVEEFGAALLRGMGWKEGDAKKGTVTRPRDVKRRQNLLGLGATELKGAEELGAWVQKSDPKRLGTGGSRGERRPRANEYKEREERKRESRDDRYGGSHHRDRDDYRDRDRDRRR